MDKHRKHQIVILGGGTAGITTAAQLLRKDNSLDIAIVEPAEKHYYQPAWTLVGAGTYDFKDTEKEEAEYIPKEAHWIKEYAAKIDPDQNQIQLKNGDQIEYGYLIVAVGIQYNWDAIPGLAETLGKNGVCSNYDPRTVNYTYECLQNFKEGNALFTQPATPIKCGGAPQKIMYLAEHYFRKTGKRDKANVIFATPGSVIFGVKKFAKTLNRIIKERDIHDLYFHKLIEVRGDRKEAVYEVTKTNEANSLIIPEEDKNNLHLTVEGTTHVVIPFEMMHLAPPSSAPDFVRESPLAVNDDFGGVDVHKHTLQHVKYSNVFALGDVAATPNAKTGAAVRKQAPVVVQNLLSLIKQKAISGEKTYNGYSSCPIVTAYGKMVLAEFDYNNEPDPSFPIDTSKERYSMWILKKYLLPWLYWTQMLRGKA